MGNLYKLIPRRTLEHKLEFIEYEDPQTPILMVHRAENVEKAESLLKEGKSLKDIYSSFCAWCGEYIKDGDCGCGHCIPQSYE